MRRAARVDANQAEIVAALRAAGASVWIIGLPVDLLVGVPGSPGQTLLMEVKTMAGKLEPKPAKYTRLQKDFMLSWRGGTVATVTDAEGALMVLKAMGAT